MSDTPEPAAGPEPVEVGGTIEPVDPNVVKEDEAAAEEAADE